MIPLKATCYNHIIVIARISVSYTRRWPPKYILTNSPPIEKKLPIRQCRVRFQIDSGISRLIKTELNAARDGYQFPPEEIGDLSIIEADSKHRNIWKLDLFKGAVRGLQIDPGNALFSQICEVTNSTIRRKNAEWGLNTDSGTFNTGHFLYEYRNAQNLRARYKNPHEMESKQKLSAYYQSHILRLRAFCDDRKFPKFWCIESEDIEDEPNTIPQIELASKFDGSGQQPNQQQ